MGYHFIPWMFWTDPHSEQFDRTQISWQDFGTCCGSVSNANRNVMLFQQDNARCHTAHVSMRYLDEQHVSVLLWLAFSPDLSLIEHLWNVLDHHVRHCDLQNADQLDECLHQEWETILLHKIQNLIWSMRRCCATVVNANGRHTWYWTICDCLKWPLCDQWR